MLGTIGVALALAHHLALAQADVDKLGKVSLAAVNWLQVITTNDLYVAHVEITFQNHNTNALKLRHGNFQTRIGPESKPVEAGQASLPELEIPGAKIGKGRAAPPITAGTVAKRIEVILGPKNDQTVEKIVRLLNVIGDTTRDVVMGLKGTTEVGIQVADGWVFKQGDAYEVELKFKPSIKREVLFK